MKIFLLLFLLPLGAFAQHNDFSFYTDRCLMHPPFCFGTATECSYEGRPFRIQKIDSSLDIISPTNTSTTRHFRLIQTTVGIIKDGRIEFYFTADGYRLTVIPQQGKLWVNDDCYYRDSASTDESLVEALKQLNRVRRPR